MYHMNQNALRRRPSGNDPDTVRRWVEEYHFGALLAKFPDREARDEVVRAFEDHGRDISSLTSEEVGRYLEQYRVA